MLRSSRRPCVDAAGYFARFSVRTFGTTAGSHAGLRQIDLRVCRGLTRSGHGTRKRYEKHARGPLPPLIQFDLKTLLWFGCGVRETCFAHPFIRFPCPPKAASAPSAVKSLSPPIPCFLFSLLPPKVTQGRLSVSVLTVRGPSAKHGGRRFSRRQEGFD